MSESDDRKRGDRRHLSATELTLVCGILFQAGVLVWGAAKLSAAVESLSASAIEIKQEQKEQGYAIQGIRLDLTTLKAQVKTR